MAVGDKDHRVRGGTQAPPNSGEVESPLELADEDIEEIFEDDLIESPAAKPASAKPAPVQPAAQTPGQTLDRTTVRAPAPPPETLAKAMAPIKAGLRLGGGGSSPVVPAARKPGSGASAAMNASRAKLDTLHEKDPLRFDEEPPTRRPDESMRGRVSDAPSIEITRGRVHSDPMIAVPPPRTAAAGSAKALKVELGDLSVEDMLASLEPQAPAASAPPPVAPAPAPEPTARAAKLPAPRAPSAPAPLPPPGSAPPARFTPPPTGLRFGSSPLPVRPSPPPESAPLPSFPPLPEAFHDEPTAVGMLESERPAAVSQFFEEGAESRLTRLQDLMVSGDCAAALELAEQMLADDPDDATAQQYAESCRVALRETYIARLGGSAQIPRVVMKRDQMAALDLDHRAGFLMACVDGSSSIDEILDVCGMPPLDALRIIAELVDRGVIKIESRLASRRR